MVLSGNLKIWHVQKYAGVEACGLHKVKTACFSFDLHHNMN